MTSIGLIGVLVVCFTRFEKNIRSTVLLLLTTQMQLFPNWKHFSSSDVGVLN